MTSVGATAASELRVGDIIGGSSTIVRITEPEIDTYNIYFESGRIDRDVPGDLLYNLTGEE